jgi:4-hydroxy-tetrahydrodipicolinate synthase
MITTEEAKARWRGVVIPLVTPFKGNGDLDLAGLKRNVRWLLERGARMGNTIFLAAGSGGDFSVMTVEERKQVISAVAETVGDRAPVIAGAQSTDIRDCIAIARHCTALSIDAIQISGPYYYDGRPDDFVAWMEELARHTDIGFALYNHFYSGAKYDVPIELIERLLDLPNSVGVKWASANVNKFYEGIHRFSPRAAVVDNTLLVVESHVRGCRAFVSHVPNYYPEFCWKIWDLVEASAYREAQATYDQFMIPYRRLIAQVQARTAGEGIFVRPFMEAMALTGGCSRLPSRDAVVTPEIRQGMRDLLKQAGAEVV